jgi:cyclopropane-fatty-acyl-phospholipid synthase
MNHTSSPETFVKDILQKADIEVNGSRSWDIQVHNPALYSRVLTGGNLALGEAYIDGWWDVDDLPDFIYRVLRADLQKEVKLNGEALLTVIGAHLFNLQNRSGARDVIDAHYDIGNDLYLSFLDPYNQYTCGYFKNTDDLAVAQEQKLDLICRKLRLKEGDTVLDIGCGWGGFAKYAAEKYGAIVTGISISKEQITYAREFCKRLPITIEYQDYRDMTGSFDKVVSVGMMEHVGYKNYRTYMECVSRVLKDDGIFLLHSIGGNRSEVSGDPWMNKYIFPHGMTPSIAQLGKAMEGLFVMEDWHNFGQYYDPTVRAWWKNLDAAWPSFKGKYGDERSYRMWKYYFLSCAGSWRARNAQLWQIVLTKKGIPGGYQSIR